MTCNHLSPLTNADKKAMDALGRDIAAVSSSRTDAFGGTEAPLVLIGKGDTAKNYYSCSGGCGGLTSSPDHWCVRCSLNNPDSPARVASRAADAQRRTATKLTPATAWDLAVRSIPRDAKVNQDVEISLEYKYDPGDRRTRDYPGEPSHVTAVSAFLPEAFCRTILRNLAYELATTSMRVRTDGGTTRGMLTEDAIHDFVQLAGEKVLNVYDAVQDVADDTAREVENPEQFKR